MSVAYLGFGGNIGNTVETIFQSWNILRNLPIIETLKGSRLYRTEPVGGPSGQNQYINAVAAVETKADPRQLLNACLEIERKHGRERVERWGPRTLDIDLLLFDEMSVNEHGLNVPHPRLRERLFVLIPLLDIVGLDFPLPPDQKQLKGVLKDRLQKNEDSLQNWEQRVIETKSKELH